MLCDWTESVYARKTCKLCAQYIDYYFNKYIVYILYLINIYFNIFHMHLYKFPRCIHESAKITEYCRDIKEKISEFLLHRSLWLEDHRKISLRKATSRSVRSQYQAPLVTLSIVKMGGNNLERRPVPVQNAELPSKRDGGTRTTRQCETTIVYSMIISGTEMAWWARARDEWSVEGT